MPTSAVPRSRWAGVSAADRKAERRGLLLDAALELLGTEGWSGTTVRGVCQAASLNPRYFYESFVDLDALVLAVHDRVVDELKGAVAAAVAKAGAGPLAVTRAVVDTTARFVDGDRRRARVLYVEALGSEALNRRRLEQGYAIADVMQGQLGGVAAAMLVGGFSEVLMAWLDGRITVSRKQLVDETTRLFLAVGEAATSKGR